MRLGASIEYDRKSFRTKSMLCAGVGLFGSFRVFRCPPEDGEESLPSHVLAGRQIKAI